MASGGQRDIQDALFPIKDVEFTNVDLNAVATTEVYNATDDAVVHGAYLEHTGATAVVLLELTDGTNTTTITPGQTAGDSIAFGDTIAIGEEDTLVANVTTAEGSALNETAAVSRGEKT